MATKEEFIEHFKKDGRPTLYREEKHIELLYKIHDNEEGIFAFCDEALITRQTFYNWLKEHPKFKEAYEIALCRSARKWEQLPRHNLNIPHPYWMTIMKKRFGYYNPKVDIQHNITANEKIDAIWEGIKEGELSPKEATQLVSIAVAQSNIESNKIDENPFKVQSTEELKERAAALTELIEVNKQIGVAK